MSGDEVKKLNARNLNDSEERIKAAESLYSNPYTMAFPSKDSVIKNVPALTSMKKLMEDAPIGTTVASSFYVKYRFVKKVGVKTWAVQEIEHKDGTARQYGGTDKRQGRTALQSMQMVLNEGIAWTEVPQEVIKAFTDLNI